MKDSTKKLIMGTAIMAGSWASAWHAGKIMNSGIIEKKPGSALSGLVMAIGSMITANMGGELIGTGLVEIMIDNDDTGKVMDFAEDHGLIYNVHRPDSEDDTTKDV